MSAPADAARAWRDARASFLFAHDLLRAPTPEQHEWLRAESTQRVWGHLTEALRQTEEGRTLPRSLDVPIDAREYEQNYLATFEVGLPHAPVPLVESHYRRGEPVPRVLHENILFHRAFGLGLRDEARETADHLRHQLELVARMLQIGGEAIERDDSEQVDQVERALEDFIGRHLHTWVPSAVEKARDSGIVWVGPILQLVWSLSRMAVPSRASLAR